MGRGGLTTNLNSGSFTLRQRERRCRALHVRHILRVFLGLDLEAVEGRLAGQEVLAVAVLEVGVFADVLGFHAVVLGEAAELDLQGRGEGAGCEGRDEKGGELDHGECWWLRLVSVGE